MKKLLTITKWAAGASLAVLFVYMALFLRLGETHVLSSVVLGEARAVSVYLPADYEHDKAYPVVYSLDGEKWRHGAIMAANVRFAAAIGRNVPSIVIAVHTQGQRRRDYVPSMGAETFLSFMKMEVMPWVDARYKTTWHRTLSGHSLGGLFSLYAMTKAPDLFQAYYAYDPSVLKDDNLLQNVEAFAVQQAGEIFLYMNYGFHTRRYEERIKMLEAALGASGRGTIRWHSRYYSLPHSLIMLPGQLEAQSNAPSLRP